MTATPAYYSTSVLYTQLQINIQTEEIVTLQDTEDAWKAQIAAVDRWEWLNDNNAPVEAIEAAYSEMEAALAYAERLEDLYHDQYRRTVWCDDGSSYVIPRFAEVLIRANWYQVEVLQVVRTGSFWAVQVYALPIDGWQPRPFSMSSIGMDPRDTGSVPLENIRVNGKRLEVK